MKYEPEKGQSLSSVLCRALDLADKYGEDVEVVFNEITIDVSAQSCVNDLSLIYDLKHSLRRVTSVLNSLS